MIEHFGGFAVRDMLGGAGLLSPKNAFTSTSGPHLAFGLLDLYLTPVKVYFPLTRIALY